MSSQEAAERIASFFISLGCHKVYDINIARHLALVESYREFKKRREEGTKLPIISSICPGWICYAEKTNGDLVIPYLSKVKSPQQIMGAILKQIYASKEIKRNEVFHLTLMPCFDKKLEASRQDFQDSNDGSQDVDCVLTPVELEEILTTEGVTLNDFEPRRLDVLVKTDGNFDEPLTSHFGSVSGGYAENLMLAEVKERSVTDCDNIEDDLEYSTLKNGDFIEINVKNKLDRGDTKLAKFAIVNGFRNIQTVVQRLKRKALKYDYIEVMACPSGCVNGGAQCRPKENEDQASTIESVKKLYNQVPSVSDGIEPTSNIQLYEKLLLNKEQDLNTTLYTNFHSVPKMQNLTVNW